jgi:hypothetical protein
VRASAAKGAALAASVLGSCPEIGRDDVEPLAVFLVMGCTSMLQAAFMDYVVDRETIRAHMHAMVRGYPREMRAPQSGGRSWEVFERLNEAARARRNVLARPLLRRGCSELRHHRGKRLMKRDIIPMISSSNRISSEGP